MVTRGEAWMIPALSRIWEACFGDSPEYIRFFMEKRFPDCQSFVWLEEGQAVGAVYLLPCYLRSGPAFYSYAGGVLPQFRRRGIFETVYFAGRDFCQEQGAELTIVPGPGTQDYYRRRGYRPAFSFSRRVYGKTGRQPELVLREADAGQYTRLRDQAFAHLDYVRWDEEAVGYALEENRLCGGFAKIVAGERDHLIFGRKDGEALEITETTLDPEQARCLAPALCRYWGAEQVAFRFPAIYGGELVENGGVWWRETSLQNGWMGLDLT